MYLLIIIVFQLHLLDCFPIEMPLDSGVQESQSVDIGSITYAWSTEFPERMSAIGGILD